MYKEPRPMKEIHQIQEKLYKEDKGLSPVERISKIRRESAAFSRRYNIRLKKVQSAK